MTFENFFHACNEKRIDLARRILISESIKPQECFSNQNPLTSPVSKALQSKDIVLIHMSCNRFLQHLTTTQLQHVRSECFPLLRKSESPELTQLVIDLLNKIDLINQK